MVIRIYGKDDAEGTGSPLLEVVPDDTSYRHREIMGDDCLTLKFSLAEHVEPPVGSWCEFMGERYTLSRPVSVTVHNRRSFEYTAVMEGAQWVAGIWKFRDPSDGRLTFSLTAAPSEHLQMLVDNLNMRERELAGDPDGWGDVWTAGDCLEGDEVCVCYDHHYCLEALNAMADAFGTEWEFGRELGGDGEPTGRRTVSLHRVEYGANSPLALSYGRGNGLKADVARSNYSDDPPVEVMYAQGGSDNIDMSKYPQEVHEADADGTPIGGEPDGVAQNHNSSALLLPPLRMIGYDGTEFLYTDDGGKTFHYEGEEGDGDDPVPAPRIYGREVRLYATDAQGYSVRRMYRDGEAASGAGVLAEDSLDCSDICPKRVGTVSGVRDSEGTDEDGNAVTCYDFWDDTIDEDLNYSDCLMAGETMTVIFQSGMLAGREFEVNYVHDETTDKSGEVLPGRRFEIVPDEVDGMLMPGGDFVPKGRGDDYDGDRYAVFGVMLPRAYFCDDSTHSGAEWDMLRECVRGMYDVEVQRYTVTGKMDGIWSAGMWGEVSGKAVPGWYVRFTDPSVQPEPLLIRIAGVKDYINSPQSPELELSNETRSVGRVMRIANYGETARDEASRASRTARSLTGDVYSVRSSVSRISDGVDGLEDTVYGVADRETGERSDGLVDRVEAVADSVTDLDSKVFGGRSSTGALPVLYLEKTVDHNTDGITDVVNTINGADGITGVLDMLDELKTAVNSLNSAVQSLDDKFTYQDVGGSVSPVPWTPTL